MRRRRTDIPRNANTGLDKALIEQQLTQAWRQWQWQPVDAQHQRMSHSGELQCGDDTAGRPLRIEPQRTAIWRR
eukprot:SAG11_NODE_203_length_12529_cov_6.036444_4_plen_74_part_00